MKIHIISNSLRMNSGFSVVAKNLAIGLKKLGHDITFTGMQTAYLSEWSSDIEVLPIQTYYVDDITQSIITIGRIKPDIVLAIFQMDNQFNDFAKLFPKTAIYCPVEGSGIPQKMASDLSYIKANGGVIVAQTKYGQEKMKSALTGIDIPYIYHGFDDKIYKPLNFRKGPDYDSIRYCYYKTENGKLDVSPILLYTQGCYGCQINKSEEIKCPYHKEEHVSILKFVNGKWTEQDIPITDLPIVTMNRFIFGFVGQNLGVRKKIERLLKAYYLFIKDSRQLKDRTLLHLHCMPISVEGIDLIKVIQDLGIQYNVIFSYGNYRSSGWTDEGMNILYNTFDVNVSASSSEGFCVLPDSPILTLDRGVQKIKDIKVGDKVLTHKGRFMRVSQVMSRQYNGDMIKITCHKLRIPLCLTPEHRVLGVKTELCQSNRNKNGNSICYPGKQCYQTINNRQYKYCRYVSGEEPYRRYKAQWIEAKRLQIGDMVVYPRPNEKVVDIEKIRTIDYIDDFINVTGDSYNDIGQQTDLFGGFVEKKISVNFGNSMEIPAEIEISKEFLRLSGYFIAEGYISEDRQVGFSFNINEDTYINDVERIMKDIFGLSCEHIILEYKNSHALRYSSRILSNMFQNIFSPKEYEERNEGKGKKSYIVRIPSEFLSLPLDKLADLIKGYWRGDGAEIPYGYNMTTTSETLAQQLVYVLSRFNILSSIQVQRRKERHIRYIVEIQGKDIEIFENIIGERHPHMPVQNMKYIKGKNSYFTPIDEIDILKYNGYVWNLEVEEDNSYVCPIVVHNCLPVLEGFAIGLPMIAPNCTAFTELIGEDEKTRRGLLASIIDRDMLRDGTFRALVSEENLAHQMKTVYQSEDLRKTFSKNAIRFAENYTWSKICVQWDELLKTI